jgi:hypothetical protein
VDGFPKSARDTLCPVTSQALIAGGSTLSDGINHGSANSDREFRDFVVAKLSRLDTNLTNLIGEDGHGGTIKEMRADHEETKKRVQSLEDSRTLGRGIGLVLGFLWTTLAGIAGYLFAYGRIKH